MLDLVPSLFLFSGYFVIAIFFVIQRLLRQGESAKSFRSGQYDRCSTSVIASATGVGLLLPLILDLAGIGVVRLNLLAGSIALIAMLCGLSLRIWAARTLGKYYTTTLVIAPDQRVVSSGPYSQIRHPGYLAGIVLWTGFGVLSSSLILLFLFPVIFVAAYLYRIRYEEKMLTTELGVDYIEYKLRTKKLIPRVF